MHRGSRDKLSEDVQIVVNIGMSQDKMWEMLQAEETAWTKAPGQEDRPVEHQ